METILNKKLAVIPRNKKEIKLIKTFFKALKLEVIESEEKSESFYDKEFVKKITKSREGIKEGKGVKMQIDDL